MEKRQVGIIGFGGMAYWHYQNLVKSDRVELKGIYDIDPKRMEFAKEQGIRTYASREELLADQEIEIVLVATPNNFHKEISIDAMKAGKHVICEKPVAMNSQEVEEMTSVSQLTGKIFTVDQNRRVDRDYLVVKKAVEDGLLGKLNVIESRVQGSRGIPEGWRTYQVAGGGMMLDWGVHLLDQILMMVPSKVTTVFTQMIEEKFPEVDEYFKTILTFENGVYAHIEVGTNHFITLPRWYVFGQKGTLEIKDWDAMGRVVRAKDTTVTWEEEIIYTKAGPTKTMAPRSQSTIEELELPDPEDYGNLLTVYHNVCDVLEGKAELSITPPQFLRSMRVMEACFQSHREKKAVSILL